MQLRKSRVEQDVSQATLAHRLNVPQTFVSKCETGIRRVDVVELRAWLIALQVDYAAFIAELSKQWDAHSARTKLQIQAR